VYDLGLDALGFRSAAKGVAVGAGRPADAREETIFGEDGDGVDEEDEDVEKAAEEEHDCDGAPRRAGRWM